MVQKYFDKFPTVNYSNATAIDITKRVALLEKVSTNPYVFYPYEISAEERADQLSYRYYGDPFKSWMIYISNKIVDPYYEWYLHDKEFYNYMELKYGSYYDSQLKIKNYRNNWDNAENITVSDYNSLTIDRQKYWEPVAGTKNDILSYKRKQIDWVVGTNKIVNYVVSNTSNFIIDEICDVVFSDIYSGKGQVLKASNNMLYLQHVSGNFVQNDEVIVGVSSYIYGNESKTNTSFSNSTLVSSNIPEGEESYWKAVTYYEYEHEKNEFNKSIRVIDSNYKQAMVDNLTDLMRE